MKDWDPAEEPDRWKANLEQWKADEARAVADQHAAQAAVQDALQAVTYITGWIAALTPAAADGRDRGAHLAAVTADLAATDAAIAAATGAIADREQARDIATARLLAGPAIGVPVTLLPMSLHTSWAAGTLRVRIYPDQISLAHHDPALMAAEKAAAGTYWATRDAGHADQAWADLVRRVGPQRAAWVVLATDPAGPAPADRDRLWTDLSLRAELLPDRFAVVAYAAGQPINVAPAGGPAQYVTWGNPIGPDPLTIAAWAGPTSLIGRQISTRPRRPGWPSPSPSPRERQRSISSSPSASAPPPEIWPTFWTSRPTRPAWRSCPMAS